MAESQSKQGNVKLHQCKLFTIQHQGFTRDFPVLDHFFGSALWSTHSLSSKLRPAPAAVLDGHPILPASPKCWGLLLQMDCTFTKSLSKVLFMVSNLNFSSWPPGPSNATEAAPSLAASLSSHSAKPQHLSMTPSCLQKQYYLGDSCITKFGYQHKVQPWTPLEHRRFCLNDTGFLWVTTNFSAPAN